MRWIDIIRISVRMLRTNGLRSLLTILGISVAISLIVLLIGVGYGLQNITIGSIVESKALLSLDIGAPPKEVKPLTLETVAELKQVPGIKDITPVISTNGEIRLNGKLASVAITAANPTFLEMEGVNIASGDTFKEDSNSVVISPKILELLDLGEEGLIGSTTSLSYTDPNNENESRTIDQIVISGISDNDSAAILYMPYSLVSKDGPPKMSEIKAVATNRDSLIQARDSIVQKGYLVETLVETLDQARSVFRWVTVALATFGTIALLVAAIGMFNTLTISLLERTREIGIMKAIGVTDRAIKRLFLAEAGIIGFLGGVVGIALGVLAGMVVGIIINQIAVRYGGIKLTLVQYPQGFLITMVLYPIVLAFITGFYPAIRASRLNPLRALRYE